VRWRACDRWRPHLRRYRRLSVAGTALIVGVGMAAFALPLDQSPLVLGPIAVVGVFLVIRYRR